MSFENFAQELERVSESAGAALLEIEESAASLPRRPGAWSRKQVLGHLIDSASNNHQRFVRLQLNKELSFPSYEQEEWVLIEHAESRPWHDLVDLWIAYNRHLAHVIRHADANCAGNVWHAAGGDITLHAMMQDYLRHLKHHLAQILNGREREGERARE